MLSKVNAVMGTTIGILLVPLGLWGWASAGRLAAVVPGGSDKSDFIFWAVRSAAVAALAGAQVLGLAFLVDSIRGGGRNPAERNDRSGQVMRLLAGAVCTVALAGAFVLAVAGK